MLPLLAINAIAMMTGSLGLWLFAASSPQLTAHVAFALGIMPLILAAVIYFVPVLTRGSGAPRWFVILPIAAWAGGLFINAAFALALPAASHVAVHLAALLASVAALTLLVWIARRAGRTLGKPHPGLHWYLAALFFLSAGLLIVPAMSLWPEHRAALRLIHLHANLLGFVGLTAIGTLQVLLPTAVGHADKAAVSRLTQDLKFAVTGAALIATGAAWSAPLAIIGAILFLIPLVRMGSRWAAVFFDQIGRLHGAAASLSLACFGLVGMIFAGFGHASAYLEGRAAVTGFILSVLLPLVTGAATQLLPVWLRPGRQEVWHDRLRETLGRWSGLRALLLVAGGLAVAFGRNEGLWLAAAGILMFAAALLTSARLWRHS